MGGPRYSISIICGWAHLYIILSLAIHYGWAQIYYICYVRVGPPVLLAVHYGWAQIHYIHHLRVGPPVYNIIISCTLWVGPNILYLLCTGGPKYNIYVIYKWAPHLCIILLLAVHYRSAQIYFISHLQVGPPVYNIIISHSLQMGPDILNQSSTGSTHI